MPGKPALAMSSALAGLVLLAAAAAADGLSPGKQTKAGLYLTAAEAAELLADPAVVFIDVRSRSEVTFIGLPTRVDMHIPYMVMPMVPEYDPEAQGYKLEINPDFPMVFEEFAEARKLSPDARIVLMCRSGSRSAKAANLLYDMGFRNVYSVVDGFEGDKAKEGPFKGQRLVNGWKNAGLKWSYAIAPSQAYPDDRM